ncbi:MAG: DUF4349 domain-containing protein [Clostridia bacterium]|nr:DUF4349 domain-containing protein [Clostridia bacterium]
MKKRLFAIALCMMLLMSFAACGAASDKLAADTENGSFIVEDGAELYSADIGGDFKYSAQSSAAGGAEAPGEQKKTEEKIIKTVDLSIQTKEYEAYIAALTANVTKLGGYVENSTNHMGSYYSVNSNRSSTYVVRIPADKLDEFLAGAEEKGKITRKTENQENVTLEYVDLESRINAYKTERTTLTGLLEKAESLEDVLSIQERLSEVNYQIETFTAQMRVLENRIGYSTVTLNIDEVERVTEEKPTLGSRIKNTFLDNLDDLVEGLGDFVVNFIGGLPIILPVAAVIVAAILILRKIIKKRKHK